jgi:formate hydrogenlyase subunit 3/multisubunit Na+/H+ antiporter MnhD subunit
MNEKVIDKATEYIDALAAKLGVAAEHVYEVLVHQKVMEGVVYSIFLPLVLAILIWVFFKIKKSLDEYDGYNEEGFIIALIITAVVILVMFIVNVVVLPDYVMQIFNPEYYAIREIIDALGGGK